MKFSVLSVLLIASWNSAPAADQPAPVWESAARLRRLPVPKIPLPKKSVTGTLIIDSQGVAFQSEKHSQRWDFQQIHTFDLSRRDLILTLYQNRRFHEPGERRLHFQISEAPPPAVASLLVDRVGRPARNGAPETHAPAFAEIPARHPTSFGGSNGTLRLRDTGIDYVSSDGGDSHSWRWTDIQTIANPDPYSLRVTAYREVAAFELKRPLTTELFDRLWDKLYARDLNLSTGKEGGHQ
jgi:hypothetical protein